jgi:hypothetical protein
MLNIFVSGVMEGKGNEPQRTDHHWRSKNGEGLFNWRFVFPISLPCEIPRLKFQARHMCLSRERD